MRLRLRRLQNGVATPGSVTGAGNKGRGVKGCEEQEESDDEETQAAEEERALADNLREDDWWYEEACLLHFVSPRCWNGRFAPAGGFIRWSSLGVLFGEFFEDGRGCTEVTTVRGMLYGIELK